MTIQEYAIESAQKAADEMFRYARAVPADKLEWTPAEGTRTVLSMCQEIAMTPTWAYDILSGKEMDWSEDAQKEQSAMMKSWKSVADCEKQFDERFAKLRNVYLEMPDSKLSETKWLPFEGGRDFTFLEMLDYPRWNANYHTGQIAYIQICYGDKEMH